MVFTCRVPPSTPAAPAVPTGGALRRRTLLVAAGGGVVGLAGGCRIGNQDKSGNTSTGPLPGVLAATLGLIGGYQATVLVQPGLADRLNPLLADHLAHVTALQQAMGRPSSAPPVNGAATSSGVPGDPTAALAQLRAAEQSAQVGAVGACVSAPQGYAALLGSIAACRATHVEALS